MATIMNQHQSHHITHPRVSVQKVAIGVGILLVASGLIGVAMPGLLGLHMSFSHNVIHLIAGSLAIWCGYSDDPKKSYGYAMGFGVFFGLIGLLGFVIGEPGYPGVGHMEADENLMRVIPNVLEFGTADHIEHLFFATALLLGAYAWIKRREDNDSISRTVVDTQARRGSRVDMHRRSDFERRI